MEKENPVKLIEFSSILETDNLKNIILAFMMIIILIGSFLPLMKEESYEKTEYYNFYQYAEKLLEEVNIGAKGDPVGDWVMTLIMFENDGWGGDVFAGLLLGLAALAVIVIFIAAVVIIGNYLYYKEIVSEAMFIVMVAAEIFAVCSLYLVCGGIANGDDFFTHYNYVWGEILGTDRAITPWLIVLLVVPVLSFMMWKKHPYNQRQKFVLEKKTCPRCGNRILIGDKCLMCEGNQW